MTNRTMRAKNGIIIRDCRQVLIQNHTIVYHGTYLQKVELTSTVIIKVNGKLNFNRAAHLVLSILKNQLQEFRKWEDTLLQNA